MDFQENCHEEYQRETPRGGDRYKIIDTCVAVKSRCVAAKVYIVRNIYGLRWSGRRDSNPRPSAPKTGQTVYGNLLKLSENKCF